MIVTFTHWRTEREGTMEVETITENLINEQHEKGYCLSDITTNKYTFDLENGISWNNEEAV